MIGLRNEGPGEEVFMAEVAHETQHEYWRPPMQAASDAMGHQERVQACDRCGTEYIVGSRYCHTCGSGRADAGQLSAAKTVAFTSVLAKVARAARFLAVQFLGLGERIGLPFGAFMAFLVGILCALCALGVSVVFSTRTVLDWQAVQIWRIEWLLGAASAFGAGCLLKRAR